MKNKISRLLNAIKVFKLAYKNPNAFDNRNMQTLINLHIMICKVAEERRPYMNKLTQAITDEGVVNIWAGFGIESCPTKRIEELLKENELLRQALKK
jgi:hypothetical protein